MKKKLMAGLLSLVMMLSMVMPAFAAELTTSTINPDPNARGSITINKYEGNDTTKPLAGVTFKIYKIANIEQKTTNGSTEVVLTPVEALSGLTITGSTEYANIKEAVEAAITAGTLTADENHVKVTNDAGQAVFSNLELGVYVVVETDAPPQIVEKTANFIVSVPMVNEAGNGWNYNIVANPKNSALYTGIQLHKIGRTLNLDGTKVDVNLEGVEFRLEYKEKTTDVWTAIDADTTKEGVQNFLTDSNGNISIASGLKPGYYQFVEVSLDGDGDEKDENLGYILDGTPYKFQIVPSEDNKKLQIVIGNNDPVYSAVIEAKNEKPVFEKEVINSNEDADDFNDDTDERIGKPVTWRVSATVPSNVGLLEAYALADTMGTGITWVSDEYAELTIVTDPAVTLIKDTDYTLTTPTTETKGDGAAETWRIEFTKGGREKLQNNKVTEVVVTFKTKVNEDAKTTTEGNINTGELEYSNRINPEVEPGQPTPPHPSRDEYHDQAIVYTFKLDVVKEDESGNKLAGAKFDLYKYNGTESVTEAILKTKGEKVKTGLETNADGRLVETVNGKEYVDIKGLENGTYYLVETQAPVIENEDGTTTTYNLLKEPLKVVLNVDYATKTDTTIIKDENGKVISKTTITEKIFNVGEDESTGTFTITVINKTGFELPTTGGMGMFMFTIIGAVLMIGGAAIMFKNRKKSA